MTSLRLTVLVLLHPIMGTTDSSLEASLQNLLNTGSNLSLGTAITLGVTLPHRTIALSAGRREMHNDSSAKALPSDSFAMGSATKMFTAAAILRLVDAGKLSLDDKAAPLMDELWTKLKGSSIVNTLGPQIRNVTVRHLLQMRSGIPDFDTLQSRAFQFDNPSDDLGPVTELSFIPSPNFTCEPGTCGEYSSSNYELLGLILAQQAGANSWDDYKQAKGLPEDVLAQMPNTIFAVHGPCSKYTRMHGYSGERSTPNGPYDVFNLSCTNGWTCGNLMSTGADAAVFVRALLGKESRVINTSTQKEMMMTAAFNRGWDQGLYYGLGLMDLSHYVSEQAGSFFGHGAETYGFNGEVGYSIQHDFGLAVFANTENTYLISRVLTDAYKAVVASLPNNSASIVV